MKTKALSPTLVEERALVMLRALANPARFRVVTLLAEMKDATAAQLLDVMPLSASTLFEHLTRLRGAGVVLVSGEGVHRYYAANPEALDFLGGLIGDVAQQARAWTETVHQAKEAHGMHIRPGRLEDVAAITVIYNQGIEDRSATLETELRAEDERAAWFRARSPRHPVLVATDKRDQVMGWGSLNPFNPRSAYDHVADFSLYVAREHRGKGVGDALLGALEERALTLGYHKMVLAAFPTNPAGMRLYERHEFQTVGIYHEQGMLDGRWVDVIIMEKLLRSL